MKDKKYIGFLGLEAVALLLLFLSDTVKAQSIFELLSLPFTVLSDALGKLSLSGTFGNIFAVLIYALICLVPVFVLLLRASRKTFRKEDSMLVLLSAVLFSVIYLLINPSEMGAFSFIESESVTVSFAFWSLFGGYLILKFTSSLQEADSEKLQKLLSLVLKIIGAVFVFALCTAETKTANSGYSGIVTNFFLLLNVYTPNLFGIVAVFGGLKLLSAFSEDRYSEETVRSADKLSGICILGVKVSVIISALYNVLQLRFIDTLTDIKFSLDVPLFSLGFILLMLIMSAYIKDSKALKEDNDSFI